MSPGHYWLGPQTFEIDKDITISGAGPTTTILQGSPPHVHGAEQVVFRNLGVENRYILVADVHRFAVCNVIFRASSASSVYFLWLETADNDNHLIRVIDSSMSCNSDYWPPHSCHSGSLGIWVENYYGAYSHFLPRYDIEVKNSDIVP